MDKYSKMKLDVLRELATERDLDMAGLKLRRELIQVLKAADEAAASTAAGMDAHAAGPGPQVKAESAARQPSRYEIEWVLDLGTSKWVVAYVLLYNGERTTTPETLYIHAHSATEVRMSAAWIDNEFVHGDVLEKRAKKDAELSDKVIRDFKLPFYDNPETSDITQRVEEVLSEQDKTLDMLYPTHLKAIAGDVKASILRTECRDKFTEAELGEMFDRARVRITVPQMWGPAARRKVQAAAKAAGLDTSVPSSEAYAALAWWVDQESRKKISPDKQFGKGDSVLLGDLGRGTGDFAMIEFLETLAINSKLKAISHASGALCGSGRVHEFLCKMFLAQKGSKWQDTTCQRLKISKRDLKSRVLMGVEVIMNKFDPDHDDLGIEPLQGIEGTHAMIQITKAQYKKALEPVIRAIKKKFDVFVKIKKPSLIVLTGGFSRCQYLVNALVDYYKPQGIRVHCPNEGLTGLNSPVAMGALLRYDHIAKQKLPDLRGYAILTHEYYDPKTHGPIKGDTTDSYWESNTHIVQDRLRKIIDVGKLKRAGDYFKHDLLLEYRIALENSVISAELVSMTAQFKEHDAAMVHNRKTGTDEFRPGVESLARVEVEIDRSQLENHGFAFKLGDEGRY